MKETPHVIRAHVVGCRKALSVPVDLCDCGGRDVVFGKRQEDWSKGRLQPVTTRIERAHAEPKEQR